LSRRVVVTGIGLVSSLGIGTEATWAGLCAGRSGIRRVTRFDASAFACQIAGEVDGFDPLNYVDKKEVKKIDTFIQYAIAASDFAMKSAALTITPALAAKQLPLPKPMSPVYAVLGLLGVGLVVVGMRQLPDRVLEARATHCLLGETPS